MTALTATAAATEAHVTVATIRTWCRRGVIAATKTAGRWVIDTASLARRIAIGARRTTRTAPAPAWTAETMQAIGGSRWQRNGMDRVYLNHWAELAGLDYSTYNTGNISGATYQGDGISNSQAYKILNSIEKVWFDAADGKLHVRYGCGESRVATREQVWAAVVNGVRTALAAL